MWFNLSRELVPRPLDAFASTGPPVDDLAREAWLMDRAAEGRVSVFLTSWEGPVVVLGYAQKAEEADLEFCRAEAIPVLRRLTGGTGVIHRGDLGVGLALPMQHPWAKGIVGLYGRFLDVLGPALRSRVPRFRGSPIPLGRAGCVRRSASSTSCRTPWWLTARRSSAVPRPGAAAPS